MDFLDTQICNFVIAQKFLSSKQLQKILEQKPSQTPLQEILSLHLSLEQQQILKEQVLDKEVLDDTSGTENISHSKIMEKLETPTNTSGTENISHFKIIKHLDAPETENFSSESTLSKSKKEKQGFPKKFGKFHIIKELGTGNMGRVFLAKEHGSAHNIALKVMLAGEMANSTYEARFIREAESMKKLSHPNIIKIHEVGKEKGIRYFTMKYIDGESLADVLHARKIGTRRCAILMEKVARAIHYAHSQNIIHRDLKPENIMLDNSEPIVMDFGLARPIRGGNKLTRTGVISGTAPYMAPEQIQTKNIPIDERTDVYGLGASLYHMLTGQVAFRGRDVFSTLMQVMHNRPLALKEINPYIPQDLENICLKAMEKDKAKRYSSALEMAKELERFVEGIAVKASSSSFTPKNIFALLLAFLAGLLFSFVIPSKTNKKVDLPKPPPKLYISSFPKMEKKQKINVPSSQWELEIAGKISTSFPLKHIVLNKENILLKNRSEFKAKIHLNYGANFVKMLILEEKRWFEKHWQIIRPYLKNKAMFRKNIQRTGTVAAREIPKCTNHRWRFKTGFKIESSPIVVDGMVFFGSNDHIFYALDAKSGKKIWYFPTKGEVKGSPCVDKGFVYFGSNDHIFYALDMHSGRLKWKYHSKKKISSSPIVVENVVYVGGEDYNFYALDAKTGAKVWRFKTNGKITSLPAIAINTVCFISYDLHLYALNMHTGKKKWAFKINTPTRSSPAIKKGIVYFCDDEYFYALEIKTKKLKWKFKTKNSVGQKFSKQSHKNSCPLLTEKTVYFGSSDSHFYALDIKTGRKNWQFRKKGQVFSSPIISAGTIYFGSKTILYALDVRTGKKKWQFKVGGGSISSPALTEEAIFFGCFDSYFYAVW